MTKLLLVDDEERLLQNLHFFFEDEGFDVLTATSGEEALDLLRREPVQVCMVDMRLPGIDGNEVIRTAFAEHLLDRFIIHTGSTDYRLPQDLEANGLTNQHVFIKPVSEMKDLVRAINKLL